MCVLACVLGVLSGAAATATAASSPNQARASADSALATDADGDGIPDDADTCTFVQPGTHKANGCVVELVKVTTRALITGDRSVGSNDGLVLNVGAATNEPGQDSSVHVPHVETSDWHRCTDRSDTATCEPRNAGGPGNGYVVGERDLGGYVRARVTWSNGDDLLSEWTAATPVYTISVGPRPALSGTPQVGQSMTGDVGSAVNLPATEPGDAGPSVRSSSWRIFGSPTDEGTCQAGPAGAVMVIPPEAQGMYLRFDVVWSNGTTSRSERSDVSGQVAAAPPVMPAVLDLSTLTFPKKVSVTGLSKSKGRFTIKQIKLRCPTGGAACRISLAITTKVKRKTKKLGSSSFTIEPGQERPLSGRLSSSGRKLLRSQTKLTATIAMKGSGGGTGKSGGGAGKANLQDIIFTT